MAKKSSDKSKTVKRGTADTLRKLQKKPIKKKDSGKGIDTIIDTQPPPDHKPKE